LEREASTARKLESVELQLRAERAGREASANQLLRAEDGAGEREAAWEAQKQILIQDAERLREELGVVGRERDNWRLRMEAVSGVSTSSSAAPTSGGLNDFGIISSGGAGGYPADYTSERKAYEAEITELSNTCTALREELRLKDDSTLEERRSLRSTIDSLERERSSLTKRVSSLEIQVTNAPSQDVIDKMRHELRILKRLEYNAVDYDHSDPEMTGKDDDLESVLVAKLRKVEADLVRERREKTEGHTARDELNQRLLCVQKELDTAQELIERLENDLQVAVATPTSFSNPATPVRSTTSGVSTNPPDPNTLQRILDPNAPPIRSLFPQDMSATTATTNAATSSEKAQDDHSVATIIMAQRDRLRSRCDALEAERDSFKRELQAQVQAAEGMKTDNTKLYEKVRYLQSFSGGNSAYSWGNNRASGDLDLEALEQRYEASVDPFRQFSRAERQRKFK
jgi:homeobox protein cut-like